MDWILVDYYGVTVNILYMIIIFWLCRRMFLFLEDIRWTTEIYIPCCLQLIFKWFNTEKEKCVCVYMHACICVWACVCVHEYQDREGEWMNIYGKLLTGPSRWRIYMMSILFLNFLHMKFHNKKLVLKKWTK